MATKVKATNLNILKAVVKESSYEIQNRLPQITQENLNSVYEQILTSKPLRNEIVPALVERIGMQTVDSIAWRNPLARFKKDPLRYGSTHEETYVNMCKGKVYDSQESYEYAFKQYQSYIMSVFHTVNLRIQYPVTVTFDNLRSAFLSEYGIKDMISAKMESAITGANWDEYLAMRGLIDTGYEKQVLPAVQVEKVINESTAKNLLSEIKRSVYDFMFPTPDNNTAGATSSSKKINLLWITTPTVNAKMGVEALAYAFNVERADIEVQTVVVDKFKNTGIQGVVCDVRFFNCRDVIREMTDQRLANVLSWNYFYTMIEMISPSLFYPVRVFTTDTVAESITVTGTNTTYTPSTVINLKAELTASDGVYIQQLIDYEITSGNTSKNTYILPGTNQLFIGDDETGTIIVKVSYRLDTSATTNITVSPDTPVTPTT